MITLKKNDFRLTVSYVWYIGSVSGGIAGMFVLAMYHTEDYKYGICSWLTMSLSNFIVKRITHIEE